MGNLEREPAPDMLATAERSHVERHLARTLARPTHRGTPLVEKLHRSWGFSDTVEDRIGHPKGGLLDVLGRLPRTRPRGGFGQLEAIVLDVPQVLSARGVA